MPRHGFVRVAAAVPTLRVGDPAFNADRTLGLLDRATADGVEVVVFPEMGLTGYTCGDLFHQTMLLRAALAELDRLADKSGRSFHGLAVVGLPVVVDDQVFNCAAVLHRGRVLGLVPKSYLPNYKEFYDARYFAAAATARSDVVRLASGETVPFGTDLLFHAVAEPDLIVGIEICEDLWTPVPPSSLQALAGANLLLNLSASNEVIGKAPYRRQLVAGQSGRCIAGYIYTSCGVYESTTDLVFGGHCLIAENGTILVESERFRRDEQLVVTDVDLDRLRGDRLRTTTFAQYGLNAGVVRPFRRIEFTLDPAPADAPLTRFVGAHPFVPQQAETLRERCDEIFHTQVAGLAKRLEHIASPPVTIGVSGGLDSTLALLVACKTFDVLGVPRSKTLALTMPGFGTTGRTLTNARGLMKHLGVTAKEIDIRPLCLAEWKALGHSPFGIACDGLDVDGLTAKLRQVPAERRSDLVFENVQARVRTELLMNAGFVIGTGDVSELALGWCTYNADHMSMYNVNVSIPKTLVKFLVGWAAAHEFSGEARKTLEDIVATEISPELLPTDAAGAATQSTEATIGPYELHDFFLYHFLRYGAPPEKIVFLAKHAKFHREYSPAEVKRWLTVFLKRFFANQYKRSALPDGPKVGTVSLSPRGDWRMPSDAAATAWLDSVMSDE
jgi:NAD+ synthase (glutamine-hydrolysing)